MGIDRATAERASSALALDAGDLTGAELLAIFELKADQLRFEATPQNPEAARAASLAITAAQDARVRYTEAILHMRDAFKPVDIERLDFSGISPEQERERFNKEHRP